MTDAVNRFFDSLDPQAGASQSALIGLFVYFLTIELGQECATPRQVSECFVACDLATPKNIAARFYEGTRTKPPKFIGANGRYRLERQFREELSRKLGTRRVLAKTSSSLRALEQTMPSGGAKGFLQETIDCLDAGAKRATVVMAWILAMDHLCSHIMSHNFVAFNGVLATNTDRRVKVKVITQRDDLADIKESKLIELCRSARIISTDVRKILDQKLAIRNSYAHPSGIEITDTKVIDFVEDLVTNVVLKYNP